MRPRIRPVAALLFAALLPSACERRLAEEAAPRTPPEPPAAGPPAPAPSPPDPAGTPAAPDAAGSRPPRFPATGILVSATAVEPAARVALDPAAENVVDPGASFEVVLSARASDARLVLLDAQDAQLPTRGTTEVGRRTTLTLAPTAPLTPGSRYVLRVEGAVERTLHDAAGRAFEPLPFPLLAAGTPPPPEPPKRSRRRRR